jgi:O-antigen ligase
MEQAKKGGLARAAMALLLLYVISLAFMQPRIRLLGYNAVPSDIVFVPLALVWGLAVLRGQAKLIWDRAWWPLLFYFAAMTLSLLATATIGRGAIKLASQVYLLSLPVIAVSLIDGTADLRRIFRWWIAAMALLAAMAVAALLLFYVDRNNPLLARALYRFGTLAPGAYPRFQLSFTNANMLCNYLSVSLMILLASLRLSWVPRVAGALVAAGLMIAAAFTISPGLGGIALVVGLWLGLTLPSERRLARSLALGGGAVVAVLFIVAMAVTPILHSTAPYLIRVPLIDLTLAPAGRLMIWTDAVRNFVADPLLGRGLGADAVLVRYQDPSGNLQRLTDAHNSYLNIAVQCGLLGLAGLVLVTLAAWKAASPFRIGPHGEHALPVALGVAFIGAFVYQGLGGSFEDARHLWLLFGLLVASRRLEPQPRPT